MHSSKLTLVHPGQTITLEAKTMELLTFMVQHQGEVLSRQMLLDAVWGDTVISDNTLSQTITKLRKALGDSAQASVFIQTIPKRGYLFRSEVEISSGDNIADEHVDEPMTTPAFLPRLWRSAWFRRPALIVIGLVVLLSPFAVYLVIELLNVGHYNFTQERLFSDMSGDESSPKLSPDGQYVLFSYQAIDSPKSQIWIKPTAVGGQAQQLSQGFDDRFPVWGADQQIGFVRRNGEGRCDFMVANITFMPTPSVQQIRSITACRDDDIQSRIIFGETDTVYVNKRDMTSERYSIWRYNLHSGRGKAFSAPGHGGKGDFNMFYMYDTDELMVLRDVHKRIMGINFMPLRDGDDGWVNLLLPWISTTQAWQNIAVGEDDNHAYANLQYQGLYRLELHTAIRHKVYDRYDLGDLDFNSASNALIASTQSYTRQLGLLDIATQQLKWLDIDDNVNASMAVDANDTLYFIRQSEGQFHYLQRSLTGVLSSVFMAKDASGERRLQVASNGTVIEEGLKGGLSLFDPQRQEWRDISDDESAINPVFNYDETGIFYASYQTGEWQIWFLDLATSTSEQVSRLGADYALPSRDGAWLYYSQSGSGKLWRQKLAEENKPELMMQGVADSWQLYDNSVYFIDPTPQSAKRLMRYSFNSQTPELLQLLPQDSSNDFVLFDQARQIALMRTIKAPRDLIYLQR